MIRRRTAAVIAVVALVGLALTLARTGGGDTAPAASQPRTVATPPETVPADVVVLVDSGGSGDAASPPATPPAPEPKPDPKPKPPLVGPGGLTTKPTTTTTVKPGLDLDLVAALRPAKLVRVTPGPLTLAAKGFAHARELCLRNSGDLGLDWELSTDVMFKSSPLSGHLAGGDATCIKVWTVHPDFHPGMTKTLVIASTANSVSIGVRLAD